jgi:hypothetical protein
MHTEQQQEEMLSDFSAHPTRAALYEPTFTDHLRQAWPNTPPSAFARDAMAEYILGHYRPCATLSIQILFMMRNDLKCPQAERP